MNTNKFKLLQVPAFKEVLKLNKSAYELLRYYINEYIPHYKIDMIAVNDNIINYDIYIKCITSFSFEDKYIHLIFNKKKEDIKLIFISNKWKIFKKYLKKIKKELK